MKKLLLLFLLAFVPLAFCQPTPVQGVGKLVAGTNITLSPTSGTGSSVTINSSGGSGGTPGGSDTQLQYNNLNAFGGISGATTNGTVVVLTSPTITTKISPTTDDGAPLGDTTHNWSDLFIASGGVFNWANGNVVLTQSSGILTLGTGEMRITTVGTNTASVVTVGGAQTLTSKILTAATVTTGLTPTSNDGAALGSVALQFSDLFLAEGGVINWDNGDATLTQAGNVVTLAGAVLAADIGSSTATTQSPGDNSTKVATTAYVAAASGTPGGSTTQVQFNLSSAFAGDSDMTFVTDTLTVTKAVTTLFTNNGTEITGAASMGALAIDVTKELNTKSISVDSTFTFSGTPGTSRQWFGMEVTNSDTSSHILTIPSSFSVINGAAITTLTIPASAKLFLIWNYDGSAYNVYGDPTLVGTLISSSIATGSAVSLTTATSANITNITLTPGTWSMVGSIVYKPTAATSSRQDASVNSTSATLSTTQGAFKTTFFITTISSVNFTNEVPEQIITVTSNTTYYLVAQITFSAGTMAAFGELHATRIK